MPVRADTVDGCLFVGAKAVVVLVFPDSYSASFAREAVRARIFTLNHARTCRALHTRGCIQCCVGQNKARLSVPAGVGVHASVPVRISGCSSATKRRHRPSLYRPARLQRRYETDVPGVVCAMLMPHLRLQLTHTLWASTAGA